MFKNPGPNSTQPTDRVDPTHVHVCRKYSRAEPENQFSHVHASLLYRVGLRSIRFKKPVGPTRKKLESMTQAQETCVSGTSF